MHILYALSLGLVATAAAHSVRRSQPEASSRRALSRRGKESVDPKLVFASHPLLGGAPIPKTAEEIVAAKQPNYIYWANNVSNNKRSTLQTRFSLAEHAYLGDSLVLEGPDGNNLPPLYNFVFPNGLNLTYGEINCLAGDFYGTYDPISDGTNINDQMTRFRSAYALLATDTSRQPEEARDILSAADEERQAFAAAVAAGQNTSAAYAALPDSTAKFELITITRPLTQPGYLGLAAINFDHFGADARTAYNAGHLAALQAAAGGDLLTAYTMNAFADHFLEDSFAAGHLRTPRRYLHDTVIGGAADLCSKYMHDEDNAIGLNVSNPSGATWVSHGDNYLMDTVDTDNVAHAHNALQISVAEVLNAWKTKTVPAVGSFGVWAEAPTLESARGPQTLVPLFRQDGERRDDVADRHTAEFTQWYSFVATVVKIEASRKWNYPIVMT